MNINQHRKMRIWGVVCLCIHLCIRHKLLTGDLVKMTIAQCEACVSHISKSISPTVIKLYRNINQHMRMCTWGSVSLYIHLWGHPTLLT